MEVGRLRKSSRCLARQQDRRNLETYERGCRRASFDDTAFRELTSYVVPSILQPDRPMSQYTYSEGWKRMLERAKVPHVGTHGIRHRATTEIANCGVPVKVGMQLTGHKTVTQFMRYVHTEDDSVRAAAETVASRRRSLLSGQRSAPQLADNVTPARPTDPLKEPVARPADFEDGRDRSNTKLGNYRPFRHRSGPNRAVPPETKLTGKARLVTAE